MRHGAHVFVRDVKVGLKVWRCPLVTTDIASHIELIKQAVACGQTALSEYESKRVLAEFGVPVVREELAHDAAEAVRAAQQLGYPVVVKACAPALMHKSDLGCVALNLADAAAVEAAVDQVGKAAGVALDGYLVQRMAHGKREVIVGGTRDKVFGPCVMLGIGGILVEVLGDVTFRLAPLDERDAEEMLYELRAQEIFGAVRGEPPVDRSALVRVLTGLGRVLIECPEVSQVDVNPLIFDGADPVAVDALITLGVSGPESGEGQ